MNLFFWRKKQEQPKRQLRRFIVEGEAALKLAHYYDKFYRDSKASQGYAENKILFWMSVAELFPETAHGCWDVEVGRLGITIVEED